ncbi:MAG TPA: hypothetical protein VII95_09045 [Terriglobales bacterium]|jgi:hypothetical protein
MKTYEEVAALFAQYEGNGKGIHHNRMSTTRVANPSAIFFPKLKDTSESMPTSVGWDKLEIPFADVKQHVVFVEEKGESRVYDLAPAPESKAVTQAAAARRPSIDERIEALTISLELLAKQSEQQGRRMDRLHEDVAAHEGEMQRFRHALRAALEAYLGNGDGGKEQ